MDDDIQIPHDEIDTLNTLARKAGIYREALIKQGLPDDLVDQLVRDWHLAQLGPETPYSSLTDTIIRDIIRGMQRARDSRPIETRVASD